MKKSSMEWCDDTRHTLYKYYISIYNFLLKFDYLPREFGNSKLDITKQHYLHRLPIFLYNSSYLRLFS